MPLIIEDGTIVPNANSYITIAEYNDWANVRFGTRDTAPAADEDAEALILRAMDYFEAQSFTGQKTDSTQPLQWPRAWVTIDRYAIDANTIPTEVKRSIFELTYAEEIGESKLAITERQTKKEKIGSIEVEYSDGSGARNFNPAIPAAMKKLLVSSGSANFIVGRA